jgi:hypothetical protein
MLFGEGGESMNRIFACVTLLVVLASAASASAETINFVVADPGLYQLGLGDSYVLPLSDPDDIATARSLVAGGGFLIANASVMKGSDGVNRDVVASGQPLWSWHVVEFLGFDDSAVELCDGSPTYTEAESHNWAEDTVVQICYWAYTVVDELGPVAVDLTTWGRVKALYRGDLAP